MDIFANSLTPENNGAVLVDLDALGTAKVGIINLLYIITGHKQLSTDVQRDVLHKQRGFLVESWWRDGYSIEFAL